MVAEPAHARQSADAGSDARRLSLRDDVSVLHADRLVSSEPAGGKMPLSRAGSPEGEPNGTTSSTGNIIAAGASPRAPATSPTALTSGGPREVRRGERRLALVLDPERADARARGARDRQLRARRVEDAGE